MSTELKAYITYLTTLTDRPKPAKQAIGELIAEIGQLPDSRDLLTWLATLAIIELEADDAVNRLQQILEGAQISWAAAVRR